MQLHKLACSYISLHAVTWACMQVHELACGSLSLHCSMSLHEVPWVCMQFHELVCSYFLCLSSSQEFRSACLFSAKNRGSFHKTHTTASTTCHTSLSLAAFTCCCGELIKLSCCSYFLFCDNYSKLKLSSSLHIRVKAILRLILSCL